MWIGVWLFHCVSATPNYSLLPLGSLDHPFPATGSAYSLCTFYLEKSSCPFTWTQVLYNTEGLKPVPLVWECFRSVLLFIIFSCDPQFCIRVLWAHAWPSYWSVNPWKTEPVLHWFGGPPQLLDGCFVHLQTVQKEHLSPEMLMRIIRLLVAKLGPEPRSPISCFDTLHWM